VLRWVCYHDGVAMSKRVGSYVGGALAAWLNAQPRTSAAWDRVVGLVKAMGALAASVPSARKPMSAVAIRWQTEVNRRLANYRVVPAIGTYLGYGRWDTVWRPAGKQVNRASSFSGRVREAEAAAMVFSLFRAGSIGRLRECAQCSQWFFARAGQEKFCTTQCQKKRYTSTERWRAHRAEYMREYRAKRYVEQLLK
jgi:hypothetical protein